MKANCDETVMLTLFEWVGWQAASLAGRLVTSVRCARYALASDARSHRLASTDGLRDEGSSPLNRFARAQTHTRSHRDSLAPHPRVYLSAMVRIRWTRRRDAWRSLRDRWSMSLATDMEPDWKTIIYSCPREPSFRVHVLCAQRLPSVSWSLNDH